MVADMPEPEPAENTSGGWPGLRFNPPIHHHQPPPPPLPPPKTPILTPKSLKSPLKTLQEPEKRGNTMKYSDKRDKHTKTFAIFRIFRKFPASSGGLVED